MKSLYGYPDWVILGVVYNLALNARVNVHEYLKTHHPAELVEWAENSSLDKPLDVAVFTDPEMFERMLGSWIVAFLSGLGIFPEKPGEHGSSARVLAARLYGVFNREVEHSPIFDRDDE